MTPSNDSAAAAHARPATRKLSRDTVFLVGDLLPLIDFTSILLAAYMGALAYATWISPGAATSVIGEDIGRAALAAAVLAPFILCDRSFVSYANGGQTAALIRCYAVRFLMFVGVVIVLGAASHSMAGLPSAWLALWFASCLLVTALTRALLIGTLRRLERKGILLETIAVVGAGAAADQLIQHLQQTRRHSIEILGVFDDHPARSAGCVQTPSGSISDLIELGKSRPMDWILLALPNSAEGEQQAILHRLKALAVPIGLCPPGVSLVAPCHEVRYLGDGLPVTPLAQHPLTGWGSTVAAAESVVPRWILTLLGLPLAALTVALSALRPDQAVQTRSERLKLGLSLDNYDLEGFTRVAARFGQQHYGYVVTANADHLIRLHHEPSFRALYTDAAYTLLDSRFLAHLLRFTTTLRLPVCTGSDLTAKLFAEVIKPEDAVVLIGGSAEQAAQLVQRHGLKQLMHFNPPMGFIRDPAAVEACLQFIEAHSPFRYCLLAVGAPQQEVIAQALKSRGVARGLALCIGASIDFLTGKERRAPRWMQRMGMEWLFRLLRAPQRMADRYLVRGPQLFGLLRHTDIVLRARSEAQQDAVLPAAMAAVAMPAVAAAPRRKASASLRRKILAPRALRRAVSSAARRAQLHSESAPAP